MCKKVKRERESQIFIYPDLCEKKDARENMF